MRILHVIRYQATESLLPRRIPQLNTIVLAVAGDILDVEVNAYCWLWLVE